MNSRFYAKEIASKSVGRYKEDAVTLCFHELVPLCATKFKSVRFPYLLTAIGSRKATIKRARQIIRDLNAGWRPTKRSEVFRDENNKANPGWNRKHQNNKTNENRNRRISNCKNPRTSRDGPE